MGLVKLKPVENQYKPLDTLQGKCCSLGTIERKIGKQESFGSCLCADIVKAYPVIIANIDDQMLSLYAMKFKGQ